MIWTKLEQISITSSWSAELDPVYALQVNRDLSVCDESVLHQWYRRSVLAMRKLAPDAVPLNFSLSASAQTDLCEINVDESACYEEKSQFQHVVVVDSGRSFGKSLYIDCSIQSSEADEIPYHESLVHPAMIGHTGKPTRVLIGGGGEGATAREILRYSHVERLLMVDLDEHVMNMSRWYLPYWNQSGAFEDPRFELQVGSVIDFLENTEETFDVIIWDLPDAHEDTVFLYTTPVLELAKKRLAPNGVFATHAGGA